LTPCLFFRLFRRLRHLLSLCLAGHKANHTLAISSSGSLLDILNINDFFCCLRCLLLSKPFRFIELLVLHANGTESAHGFDSVAIQLSLLSTHIDRIVTLMHT
jgi:hypothetical protein